MRFVISNIVIFYLGLLATLSQSGLNNLHMYDGVSIHDVTSGDIFFEIVDPQELEYTYRLRPAKDFGAPFNSSFALSNAALIPVDPPFSCEIPKNHRELEGNVALVERGECSFVEKAVNVQLAGARAIIITDSRRPSRKQTQPDLREIETEEQYRVEHSEQDFYIEMVDDNSGREIRIPAGFLIGHSGRIIRQTLSRLNRHYAVINLPVNVTFRSVGDLREPPWLGF